MRPDVRQAGVSTVIVPARQRVRSWRWAVCLVYAVVVAVLSLAPSRSFEKAPRFFPHQDKAVHALLYAGLAGLALRAAGEDRPSLATAGFVALAVVFYGFMLEVCQDRFRPGDRRFSWGDVAANAGGSLAAFLGRRLGTRGTS